VDEGVMLREALRMFRNLILISMLALPLACGAPPQHSSEGNNEHHEEGHASEHKHAHGKGIHKHAHGGEGDHSKHRHGAQPLGHRFEKAAEWAPRFDDPERDQWQKPTEVVALMEIKPGMRVADIGAGTGYFLPHLASQTGAEGSVVGLDIEPDMVRYMSERVVREKLVGVSARVVATDDPELVANSLDRILIVDTWHHMPERVAYSKKLAAGLRPGGTITIVDFTMETTRGPPKSHRLSAESILDELRAAGLQAELLSENLPDQFIVRGTKAP
jgi:predicted methyltransferase